MLFYHLGIAFHAILIFFCAAKSWTWGEEEEGFFFRYSAMHSAIQIKAGSKICLLFIWRRVFLCSSKYYFCLWGWDGHEPKLHTSGQSHLSSRWWWWVQMRRIVCSHESFPPSVSIGKRKEKYQCESVYTGTVLPIKAQCTLAPNERRQGMGLALHFIHTLSSPFPMLTTFEIGYFEYVEGENAPVCY